MAATLAIARKCRTAAQIVEPIAEEMKMPVAWAADNPAVIAHMNILQGVINRLAVSSASCKTWCLTLVAALTSLAGALHVSSIVGFALVPVAVFCYMDAMYLAHERAYRNLFNSLVAKIRAGQYDDSCAFDAKAEAGIAGLLCALTSWSIWPVYLGLAVAYAVAQHQGWLAVLATPAK